MNKFLTILIFLYMLSACTKNDQFTWENKYDDNGRLIKMIQPGGNNISFKYEMDDNNPELVRKLVKKGKGEKVVIEYDRFGRKTSMTDNIGSVKYEYDLAGNLSGVKRENFPAIFYEYNTLGQLTSIKTDNGYFANYEYDFLGRIESINSLAGKIAYKYNRAQGTVVQTLPNGIWTRWSYGPDNQLQEIVHVNTDNHILHSYNYTFSPDGLISQIDEQTQHEKITKNYSYDSEQRLVKYSNSNGKKIEYTYDELGNRIAMTTRNGKSEESTYDWAGRMQTLNDQPVKYDKAGNLLTDYNGENSYNYNVNNQLTKAGDVNYEYDGEGKLAKKNSTQFISDVLSEIWQPLVAENNGSKTFYIWNGNTPVAQVTDGEVSFLLNDHLNSPREIMDSEAAITTNQEYDPFGVPQNNNTEQFNPGFTGLFYDHAANVYLTATRAYQPEQARFLQMDPLKQVPNESQKVLSPFVYCGNDPMNFYDLNGCQAERLDINNNSYTAPNIPRKYNFGGYIYEPVPLATPDRDKVYYQRMDDGTQKQWVINTLKKYEQKYMQEFNDPKKARIKAVNEFAKDYSDYLNQKPKNENQYKDRIANMSVSSDYGPVSLDWLTTMISTGDTHEPIQSIFLYSRPLLLNTRIRYYVGKTGWNLGKVFFGGPKLDIKDMYPKSNLNAVKIVEKRIYNPSIPIENIFDFEKSNNYTSSISNSKRNQHSSTINISKQSWNNQQNYKNPISASNINKNSNILRNIHSHLSKLSHEINTNFNPFYVKDASAAEFTSTPSNVGGVYLKGAGSALEGIQSLSGIALDENSGKIILLSEEDTEIDIPPLRLDDVVTIFRCVYEQGEAPYVSIDPNPEDPKGPNMLSRHGKETENTYVGWILFETDRVMKAYSLGQDNLTNQVVKTSIASYQDVLDAQFDLKPGKQSWERFWIVPAEVNKKQTQLKELTLYDIPLKVKTEKMIMRNGKLETDPVGKSSKGAAMFSEWFTLNYEKIAKENSILPPEGSGFTEPVPIFSELQRMALITAIAEQLRDQGVPFPLWMREFEVKSCPTPPTTPAISITRKGTNSTLTIYGGVALTTTDKNIEKVAIIPEASHILEQTKNEIRAVPMMETISYESENKKMAALALPGNNTKALTPCQLNEVDVALPLSGGEYLVINRQYNSFYHPTNTEFNSIWTMNLLRLENPKRQIQTSGNKLMIDQNHFFITTPLNVYYEDNVTIYNCDDNRLDADSRMCRLQNGDKGYFNEDGYLVGYRSGLLYQYIRDENNQIVKIEAWKGIKVIGSINLNYDFKNRLSSITAENQQLVKYTYGSDGLLKYVIKPYETISYNYTGENNLVESITINDNLSQKFIYNEKAQLIAVSGEFGEIENQMVRSGEKIEMVQFQKGENSKQQKMVYDFAMRPLSQKNADKSETTWDYSDPGKTKIAYKSPEGYEYAISRTDDNQSEIINYPDGNTVASQYDSKGNLVSLNQNGEQVVSQDFHSDGSLYKSSYETFSVVPEYDEFGETSGITLSSADPEKARTNWQSTQYDGDGNVKIIQDFSGYQQQNIYDADGNLNRIVSTKGEMVLNRGNDNRVQSVQSSWGTGMVNNYAPDGSIESVQMINGDNKATMEFSDGMIKNITDFKGNSTEYEYCTDSLSFGRVEQIKKDNLLIDYEYNEEGDLSDVDVNNTFQWQYENGEKSNKMTLKKMD